MAVEDIFRSLESEHNAQIRWLLRNALEVRAERADWMHCSILRHLEADARNLQSWNELIRRTRKAMDDEQSLSDRATAILQPQSETFDDQLDDFIAEMIAAQYLSLLGHRSVRFTIDQDAIRADLLSTFENREYVTEVKNFREPRTLSYVAFARWNRNSAAERERYSFSAELLDLDDPFGDLTPDQSENLYQLIDSLPERSRPSEFEHTLPEGRRLRVRIGNGPPGMMRHAGGPFAVDPVVERCRRNLCLKLLEHTRKALAQLYSDAVPTDAPRLLFVRWKAPEEVGVIGEAGNVRDAVVPVFQHLMRTFFRRFALVVVHTFENLEDAPKADWNDL